ncbi:MAG: cytochrome C [Pseudoxanthomonas sp.]
MRTRHLLWICLIPGLVACQPATAPEAVVAPAADLLAKGEYLVKVGGCNDCHTNDYGPSGGNVPKEQWLTGSHQGFMGPWGTTYPSNLRLNLSKMSEAQWLAYSSAFHTRPPMPDFTVRDLSEEDRRALYRFIVSLGAAGQPAPAYLPPGQQPQPPYFQLVLPAPAEGAKPDGQAAKLPSAS